MKLTAAALCLTLALIASPGCDKKPSDAAQAAEPPATAETEPAAEAEPAAETEAAPEVAADPVVKAAPAPAAEAKPAEKPAAPAAPNPALLDPSLATETAPETYKVRFDTTKGSFVVAVTRAWAPLGADRFYNLVKIGFFSDVAFFRVISGFMAQFGIHGDPKVAAVWRAAQLKDDPVKASNQRGYLTFATAGPNTRSSQFFFNFGNNNRLDGMGFAPFGQVVEGMPVVDSINSEYGEGAPRGRGPHQGLLQAQGNAYLKAQFPNLDYIKSATVL